MNFDKSKIKWNGTKVGTMLIDICDLANGGKIVIVRDPKILSLSVNARFHVSSFDKAQGVPHLMEHCLFSNVYEGKSLFQCRDELTRLGIELNAQTSHKDMGIIASTASCMDINKYPLDRYYTSFCKEYDYKTLLKRLGDICYNLVTTDVNESYLEQEKNVIFGEMQTRYPGDMQSIRKTSEWAALLGGRFSSIGNAYNLKEITTDHINYMRSRTFSCENIKAIVINAPEFVDINDIVDFFISRFWDGLYENCKIINGNINKFSKEAVEFVDTYTASRYRPDPKSFLVRSIQSGYDGAEFEESVYIHKVKPFKNAATIKDIIINLPTIKVSSNTITECTAKAMAQDYILGKLNEYYREKHPVTYGVMKYIGAWAWKDKNYNNTAFIIQLSTGASTEDFLKSIPEFKQWAMNHEEIDKSIDSWTIAHKNDWYRFMNGDINPYDPLSSFEDIKIILLGSLQDSAEDKIHLLNDYTDTLEEGRLFPLLLMMKFEYIINSRNLIHDYVKMYLHNWKLNVFDSNNLREEEKAKKEFKEKKPFKKEYKKSSFRK